MVSTWRVQSVRGDLPQRVRAGEGELEDHKVAGVLLHEALLLPVDPPEEILAARVAHGCEALELRRRETVEQVARRLHVPALRGVHAHLLEP